jgi:hypothetical protein
MEDTYLRDEVEGDHVSGLGGDRVGRELELIVCSYGNH